MTSSVSCARGHAPERLPAIALSALARPEDRRHALAAGFQLHVPKPIEGSELTAAIATLVGRTGLAASTLKPNEVMNRAVLPAGR